MTWEFSLAVAWRLTAQWPLVDIDAGDVDRWVRATLAAGHRPPRMGAAHLRVVHLTRNPAASINGLVDGWHHRGFFNCRVRRRLAIRDYSDRYPAWGASWWCYDLWPGWHEWADAPLIDVCAEQWRAPHEATLDFLAEADGEVSSHRLRREDVTGDDDRRARAFADLARWLGHPQGVSELGRLRRLPPLMATATPRPRRWEARAGALAPALSRAAVTEMAEPSPTAIRRRGGDARVFDDDAPSWSERSRRPRDSSPWLADMPPFMLDTGPRESPGVPTSMWRTSMETNETSHRASPVSRRRPRYAGRSLAAGGACGHRPYRRVRGRPGDRAAGRGWHERRRRRP